MNIEDHRQRIALYEQVKAWLLERFAKDRFGKTKGGAPRICYAINSLEVSKELHDALHFEVRLACGIHPNKWSDIHSTKPALKRRLELIDKLIAAHREAEFGLLWAQRTDLRVPLTSAPAKKKKRKAKR